MQPDELLIAVRVPRRPGVPWGYQKFVRRSNDWAIVGVAAVDGRIALANMGPTPLRATAAEEALAGGASAAEAAGHAAEGTSPGEDMHADREYRQPPGQGPDPARARAPGRVADVAVAVAVPARD